MKKFFLCLKNSIKHPLCRGMDIDDPAANAVVRKIIQEKGFLRHIYEEWYLELATVLPENPSGPVLELGSGAGFMKDYVPGLITSEILHLSHVDVVMDAHHLPFADGSLKAIIMVDVFHHLSRIRGFLSEAARCIRPGGIVAMIEPWRTPFSEFIYRHFHHEPFEPEAKDWHFPAGGPLSAANMALPWMVFERDLSVFEREFPVWRVNSIRLHTPFSYLLSGGVAMRSMVPEQSFDFWRHLEMKLSCRMNFLAMFATIVIKKNSYNKKYPC